MTPLLAHRFLSSRLSHRTKKLRFYDPLCGSGSTALVARTFGIRVSASDILYPAVTIAEAKLRRLTHTSLIELQRFPWTLKVPSRRKPSDLWKNWDIWYTPRVLACLEELADRIYETRREEYSTHLRTAFFQTVWDVSAADKTVMVPTRSSYSRRPPRLSGQQVLKTFGKRLERIVKAQEALASLGICVGRPTVFQSDALSNNGWPADPQNIIFTSPAYGCGIDYGRVFRLQMRLWRRHMDGERPAFSKNVMGRVTRVSPSLEEVPFDERKSSWLVDNLKSPRIGMLLQYIHELHIFIRNCRRHLARQGELCLVIGNPQVGRREVPLNRITQRLALEEGFVSIHKPKVDSIRGRMQNFPLRSASSCIREEFLLNFQIA